MRAQVNIFWILTGFFILADTGYTIWNMVSLGHIEWAGTLTIGLCGVMSVFLGFYLSRSHFAQHGELPEDRPDANVDDGDPEVGFFNPYSWWPIALAAGCTLCFLGLAVGLWICFIGAAVVATTLVGWVFENYRGVYQH
jgi:hypothetical protein